MMKMVVLYTTDQEGTLVTMHSNIFQISIIELLGLSCLRMIGMDSGKAFI